MWHTPQLALPGHQKHRMDKGQPVQQMGYRIQSWPSFLILCNGKQTQIHQTDGVEGSNSPLSSHHVQWQTQVPKSLNVRPATAITGRNTHVNIQTKATDFRIRSPKQSKDDTWQGGSHQRMKICTAKEAIHGGWGTDWKIHLAPLTRRGQRGSMQSTQGTRKKL